jgi:hypothetical protein
MRGSREVAEVEDPSDKFLINIGEAKLELDGFIDAVRAIDYDVLPNPLRSQIVEAISIMRSHLISSKPSARLIREAGRLLQDSMKGSAAKTLKGPARQLFAVLGV